MDDVLTSVLILAAMAGALYLATRRRKAPVSAWNKLPSAAEPAGTGVDWRPAFESTAATSSPLITGEPETGTILTGSICPPAAQRPAKGCC